MAQFVLTDRGKARRGAMGPGGKVIRYLEQHGPTPLSEISAKLGPGTKRVAAALYRKGYIAREE
jgi:hypothetical protein